MKKVLLSLLVVGSLFSQDITIKSGWQLKGTETGLTISDLNKSCINTVWKYNADWEAYSPDSSTKQLIINSGITELSGLNINDGFWIKGNSDCNISTSENSNNISSTVIYNNITTDGLLKSTLSSSLENTSFKGVITVDNYAYVVSREGELLTYDISSIETTESPINTTLIGDSSDWTPTHHVIQNGNYLYITGSNIYVIDITDKANPSLVNTLSYSGKWNTPTISGNKMILNYSYDSSLARLFDISDPQNPTYLTSFSDIGKSLIVDNFIYSINTDGNPVKYSLSDTNEISEVSLGSDSVSSTPYALHFYNDKFVVIADQIYIFNTENSMSLITTLTNGYGSRASGCKQNVCIVGTKIYDLNNLETEALTLNDSTSNADGFPFQVFINDEGYIFRGSQEDIKVNKIDFE